MSKRTDATARIQISIRQLIARAVFVNDSIARQLGLRLVDLQVLNLMSLPDGPATPGDITEMTGLPSSTTTRVLDRLEAAGFLRRVSDPADRRKVSLELDTDRLADFESRYRELRSANAARQTLYTEAELELVAGYLEQHVADPAGQPR
ncbi:MarR family winged helix-turn-helix transcriptional regulator [Nocardia sp. NBC_00511]|uniref:MarR family winged helix-turn-helix transcriptional regulator n=1 Tax=Nocardia sp. NBC_00511 TaxID=2903591 RepID=UPI0030DDF132